MKFEEIISGLMKLLNENYYSSGTIKAYQREWKRLREFLLENYGNDEFDMERGLAFLEKKYGIPSDYRNETLSQTRVQRIRAVHMLEDYRLHKVLTKRYYSSKNPIILIDAHEDLLNHYSDALETMQLSKCTREHYVRTTKIFLDYLHQRKIFDPYSITLTTCNDFLKTLAGYTFKTVEQCVCGLRHFLRYLESEHIISGDIAGKIHMPKVSKTAQIPSAWSEEELKKLISVIDRNSPIGKRDYAMILLAAVLGLRAGDIKLLKFSDFNWGKKELAIIQHKTQKPLVLHLPDAVGWAVIDYIKNARPQYFKTDIIFLKHMPPFDPFGDNNHMMEIIQRYSQRAGIKRKGKRSGFHSLRHAAGSMYLEMGTPLTVISQILGHTDPDITAVYLKTDLNKLAECVLDPDPEIFRL